METTFDDSILNFNRNFSTGTGPSALYNYAVIFIFMCCDQPSDGVCLVWFVLIESEVPHAGLYHTNF